MGRDPVWSHDALVEPVGATCSQQVGIGSICSGIRAREHELHFSLSNSIMVFKYFNDIEKPNWLPIILEVPELAFATYRHHEVCFMSLYELVEFCASIVELVLATCSG
uniref:Uncharacterized protein n=1 Tax=Physcomitrium patens TaxID=3218 RepID=A0A7I3Z4Z0_PHYPA